MYFLQAIFKTTPAHSELNIRIPGDGTLGTSRYIHKNAFAVNLGGNSATDPCSLLEIVLLALAVNLESTVLLALTVYLG
jgi:hypothetical protein